MGAWVKMVVTAPQPPLWIDDTAYTSRLLLGGRSPWLDVAMCMNWRQRAIKLLRPSLAVLDVRALAADHVSRTGRLRELMRRGAGAGSPLRILLSDADLRSHLRDLLLASRASTPQPLGITVPSPHNWLVQAYEAAFARMPDLSGDDIDDAASLCADFLRTCGDVGIDAVLIDAVGASSPGTDLDDLGSIANLARYFRWDFGVQAAVQPAEPTDFLVAPSGAMGIALGRAFWEGAATPACGNKQFFHVTIPETAEPQLVQERLDRLR